MRKLTFLLCAASLCGAAFMARVAMTQDVFDDPRELTETRRDATTVKPALEEGKRFNDGPSPFGDPAGSSDLARPSNRPNSRPPQRFFIPDGQAGGAGGYPGGLGSGGGGYPGGAAMSGSGMMEGDMMDERPTPSPVRPRRITRTVVEIVYEAIPKDELEAARALQNAIQSLKNSTDEAARTKAAEIIQQQLAKQFDDDLTRREKELAEVEQRVTKLREQLDKRKAAQEAIIHLRLQTIVNDSEGLGFPDNGVVINPQPPFTDFISGGGAGMMPSGGFGEGPLPSAPFAPGVGPGMRSSGGAGGGESTIPRSR